MEKNYGLNHAEVARSLINLAAVHRSMKHLDEAHAIEVRVSRMVGNSL